MNKVKLILKPHPACGKYGEMVDIFSENGGLPWASVHIDTFGTPGIRQGDNQIYKLLYHNMETVTVTLTIDVKDGK